MGTTGRGIRRYTCARRWIYTCVYIAATRKWDCDGGGRREKERDGERASRGVVDERAGREEQNDGGARAADTGETRVKDEDTGVARASLARILISSTAHQPLAESRSFAHFISRPAKRGASWRGMARIYASTGAMTPAANWQTAQFNPPSWDAHLPCSRDRHVNGCVDHVGRAMLCDEIKQPDKSMRGRNGFARPF